MRQRDPVRPVVCWFYTVGRWGWVLLSLWPKHQNSHRHSNLANFEQMLARTWCFHFHTLQVSVCSIKVSVNILESALRELSSLLLYVCSQGGHEQQLVSKSGRLGQLQWWDVLGQWWQPVLHVFWAGPRRRSQTKKVKVPNSSADSALFCPCSPRTRWIS